jgi:uncharacterized protein YgfB (UPF0149 family)
MGPLWNRVAKRVNAAPALPIVAVCCYRSAVTHGELQAVLGRMRVEIGASEAHGWLCGALCVRTDYGAPQWLAELAEDAGPGGAPAAAEPALRELHEETLESLQSVGFAFTPLLPDEEATLIERVESLAAWCSGFLYGIGAAGTGESLARYGDVGEILGDLSEISRAGVEPDGENEAGEEDFAELLEFVRAGAQLAWDELAELRATLPAATAVH